MEAGQARLHREERLDQEEAPARTSHLVRQGAPGGDQDDPRRLLRATLLRPKSRLPSRTGMPHGPANDLLYRSWRGTNWFIEGDISACFDSLNHEIMLEILRQDIHDNRFIRLLESLFKAGYL